MISFHLVIILYKIHVKIYHVLSCNFSKQRLHVKHFDVSNKVDKIHAKTQFCPLVQNRSEPLRTKGLRVF